MEVRDTMGLILTILGGLLAVIGYIWGIVAGAQQGGALWGILNFLFPIIAPAIMAIQGKIKWWPAVLPIIGGILTVVGPILFAFGS
jgi:hypothetical protein